MNNKRDILEMLELKIGLLLCFCAPEKELCDKLCEILKTLQSIRRLSGRIQAVWLAEMIAMLGMLALNFANSDLHHDVGVYVYPAMIATVMGNGFAMDRLDDRVRQLARLSKELKDVPTGSDAQRQRIASIQDGLKKVR